MTRRSRSTAATKRTELGLWPCPSTRRWHTISLMPTMRPMCSTWPSQGFHYNRINNPTVAVLESRMAALERGVGGLALSSGAAAVRYSVRNLTSQGASVVATPQLYGATYTLFAHILKEEGVEVRFAVDERPESLEPLIDRTTRAVFCETIGNPGGNVVDVPAVSEMAHAHGVPVIVDNTVATPVLFKPLVHGADVVVHSLTKFVGGHGTTLGGMIVDGGGFPWSEHAERFPMFATPEPSFHGVVYARDFPENSYIVRCRTVGMRNEGAALSPFNAFLLLQGLETLSLCGVSGTSQTRRPWRTGSEKTGACLGSGGQASSTILSTNWPRGCLVVATPQ